MIIEACIHRSSCWFYSEADKSPAYRVLRAGFCEQAPERCEINRRCLAGKPVPKNLLPDGTTEG